MASIGFQFGTPNRIDKRIERSFPRAIKTQLIVHAADFPAYRFVDVYRAITDFCAQRERVEHIETQQVESLNQLIHGERPAWSDRSSKQATKTAWPTGPDDEVYLPVDSFWICGADKRSDAFVIRLHLEASTQKSQLEIACGDTHAGTEAVDWITETSRQKSIFRNATLQLSYESGRKDEYGDVEKQEQFRVQFSKLDEVTDADIVLADEHVAVLKRNVIDLHARREILEANNVPPRRGVLLHGPPGTGKTFACRYLCHKLPDVTRIFVTGSSLLNVGSVFSFARLMQPSLLFLEDVDLIFSAREINLYSSALGDLLDQMDGLRSKENISVILTTNAIDRLEAAIKDRPGRISQCIYLGAPEAEQRHLFLAHQLQGHNAEAVDLASLVRKSEGTTQAFLKEWTHRAVQIACERLSGPDEKARIETADFNTAFAEMQQSLTGSDGSIVGFVGRANR